MKPPARQKPEGRYFKNPNPELAAQIAVHTTELQRANRSLQLISTYSRTLVRAAQSLLRAIERTNARGQAAVRPWKGARELRARYDSLSPRERKVMGLVVKGLLNKQIAAELGTAEITVKIQRASVMKKMKAGSFADLVRSSEKLRTITVV